ncbi:MAG: tetratricopeptide repeat protein [Gammaproteobacteria bacterium]
MLRARRTSHARCQQALTGLLCLCFSITGYADLNSGVDAYKRGDYATALASLRPLAEQGNVDAQFHLGLMYANGHGVPEDRQRAAEWFDKAVGKFDASAPFNIGVMYYEGKGVAKDRKIAAEWFYKAAELGDSEAQFNLALMYDRGDGIASNMDEAIKWYEQAALQGVTDAQVTLGDIYIEDRVAPVDRVKSFVWYYFAAKGGNKRAAEARDRLAKALGPEHFSKAIGRAHELAAQYPGVED